MYEAFLRPEGFSLTRKNIWVVFGWQDLNLDLDLKSIDLKYLD